MVSDDTPLTPDQVTELVKDKLAPYFAVVGEIAATWAMLEHRLDELIWDMADVQQALGATITSQLNGPSPRLRVIKVLLEVRGWPEQFQKKVRAFDRKIRLAQEARNRAVHNILLVGHVSGTVFSRTVATVDNKLRFEIETLSLETMQSSSVSAMKALRELNTIIAEIRSFSPSPSPERLRSLLQRVGPETELRIPLDPTPKAPSPPLPPS